MRIAATITALALLSAVPLAGCGGSSPSTNPNGGAAPNGGPAAPEGASARICPGSAGGATVIRATALPCDRGRRLAAAWSERAGCAPPAGGSRSACAIGSYRCLATATGRGISVSCAAPGRSVAFTVLRPGGG